MPIRVQAADRSDAILSPTEFALLEFTNDFPEGEPLRGPILCTTKESYIWATVIALVAQETETNEEAFERALRTAARGEAGRITTYFRDPDILRPPSSEEIFEALLRRVGSELHLDLNLHRLQQIASQTLRTLQERELVEDPVDLVLGSLTLLVLGLLPVNFSRTKQQGRVVKRHYKSLLLDYSRQQIGGKDQLDVYFRIQKLIAAFKPVIRDLLSDQPNKGPAQPESKSAKSRPSAKRNKGRA
jgi:hypothetical protein